MASGTRGEPVGSWNKDPDATRAYGCDWSDWLTELGTSISASTWTAASDNATGMSSTGGSTYSTGGTTRKTFTGGTPGESYYWINQITTAGGEVEERTIEINVLER